MRKTWRQWLLLTRQHFVVSLVAAGVLFLGVADVTLFLRGNTHPRLAPARPPVSAPAHIPLTANKPAPADGGQQTSPPPSTTPPAPKPQPAPLVPASVIDLTNWRLTLPIDTAHAGNPDEINQPELTTFVSPPYFALNANKDGVVFQAHAGGATTNNSKYPRSELREMTAKGAKQASWSNTTGTHTMNLRQAITHLPVVKPEVVAAQIHDASDDVVMVKLSGNNLFVEAGGKNIGTLDANYTLGTTYNLKIVASDNHIYVDFNGERKVDYAKSGSGYYFKAGCYTQTNTSKGDAADAYAQVVIYNLAVTHS